MKQELQRIEATLDQLADQSRQPSQPNPETHPSTPELPIVSKELQEESLRQSRSLSFDLQAPAIPSPSSAATEIPSAPAQTAKRPLVEPFPMNLAEARVPTLPKLKSPSLSSHRNAANPVLAMSLLKEIEAVVSGWQDELQAVIHQIQDLYLEGPIVDGWLESYAQEEGEAPEFRHADVDCLMDYVDKLRPSTEHSAEAKAEATPATETAKPDTPSSTDQAIKSDAIATGYRLCGLNEDGQLWFRHCPPHQLPAIGLAIARYQRLRQLLTRKQYLETRLGQLAETLVSIHGQLIA